MSKSSLCICTRKAGSIVINNLMFACLSARIRPGVYLTCSKSIFCGVKWNISRRSCFIWNCQLKDRTSGDFPHCVPISIPVLHLPYEEWASDTPAGCCIWPSPPPCSRPQAPRQSSGRAPSRKRVGRPGHRCTGNIRLGGTQCTYRRQRAVYGSQGS